MTFNTLRNQGYRLGHNYGHGKHHLSAVPAFAVDQCQELGCPVFRVARAGCLRELWARVRAIFRLFWVGSMGEILRMVAGRIVLRPVDRS